MFHTPSEQILPSQLFLKLIFLSAALFASGRASIVGTSDFATPTLGPICEASGDRKVRGAGSETGEVKNSFWLFLGK